MLIYFIEDGFIFDVILGQPFVIIEGSFISQNIFITGYITNMRDIFVFGLNII